MRRALTKGLSRRVVDGAHEVSATLISGCSSWILPGLIESTIEKKSVDNWTNFERCCKQRVAQHHSTPAEGQDEGGHDVSTCGASQSIQSDPPVTHTPEHPRPGNTATLWWCGVTALLATGIYLCFGQSTLYHTVAGVVVGLAISLYFAGAARAKVLLNKLDIFNVFKHETGRGPNRRAASTPRAPSNSVAAAASFSSFHRDPLGSLLATPRHSKQVGRMEREEEIRTSQLCAEVAHKLGELETKQEEELGVRGRRSLVGSPPRGRIVHGDSDGCCAVSPPGCCLQ